MLDFAGAPGDKPPRVMSGHPGSVAPDATGNNAPGASAVKPATCNVTRDISPRLILPSASEDARKSVAGFTEVQALEKRREEGVEVETLDRRGPRRHRRPTIFFRAKW